MLAFSPDISHPEDYRQSLYAKEWKMDESMEKNIVDSRFVYNAQFDDFKDSSESRDIMGLPLLYEIQDLLKCLYNKEGFLVDYDITKQELIYEFKDWKIRRKPRRYLPGHAMLINESICLEYFNDIVASCILSLNKSYADDDFFGPRSNERLQSLKKELEKELKEPSKFYNYGEKNNDWYSLIPIPEENEIVGEPIPWDFILLDGQIIILPKAYQGVMKTIIPSDVVRNAFLNEEIYLQKTKKVNGGSIEYYPVSREKNCSAIEKVQEPVKKEEEPITKNDDGKWHPNQPQKKEALESNLNQPNIDPEILEIQQQILDLICLADKLGKHDMLVPGNKVTVSNTQDVGGIDYIYFGVKVNREGIFSYRKHILTAVRESDVPNYRLNVNTLKVTEVTIPEVNKKLLIKARNHLEKTLGAYHYGGEEQKGYYMIIDPKNFNCPEAPINCEQYHNSGPWDGPWLIRPFFPKESKLSFPKSTPPYVEDVESFCDSVSKDIYFQEYDNKRGKVVSHSYAVVIKAKHCLSPINNLENVVETPKVETKVERTVELNNKDITDEKKIEIKGGEATIYVWDHQMYDHDIVDVYVNGKLLQEGLELKKQEFKIPIVLTPGQENNIQFVAKSTGTAGGCTIRAKVEETGEEFTMEAPKGKIMKIDLQRK